jgi:hypothetical protein
MAIAGTARIATSTSQTATALLAMRPALATRPCLKVPVAIR